MSEDELRELKAYKMGYDLGWFRASEALESLLTELEECMERSATWKQIEKEGKKNDALFYQRILGILIDLKQIRNEQMPAIVLEQKAINDMGERLKKLTAEDWKLLRQQDSSSLDLNKRKGIKA